MGINIIVTLDVDNDGVEHNERNRLTWSSLERIPEIKSILSALHLKTTWFVRADNQLKDVYGTAAYLLEEHAVLWRQMECTGDEIGWHPHIYEWSEAQKSYIPDLNEIRRSEKLRQVREELVGRGNLHTSARMGEAFHTNASMKTLENLSVKVDATAIPGRKRQDPSRWFDWSTTSNEPYYPSETDYRVPGLESHLDLLEVPMTTAPIKTSYDPIPFFRYLNPIYQPDIFKSAIEWVLKAYVDPDNEYFLTLALHPDEVIPKDKPHELYAFSLGALKFNMNFLLRSLEQKELTYKSITVSEAAKIFETKSVK